MTDKAKLKDKAHVLPSANGAVQSAEDALLLGRAPLQSLLDQTPMGVYLVDADFRIRMVNSIAKEVFGAIPNLIGLDFGVLVHQLWSTEYADEIVRLFRHTLETGEPYNTSERIEERRDLGVTESYEWQISRIPEQDGRYGVACYFRDVSTQVLSRLALSASEEKYRTLFDSIDQGFFIVEAVQDASGVVLDYRYQQVNSAFLRISGLPSPVGKLITEVFPQIESYWIETLNRAVTGEQTRMENYNEDTQKWYLANYTRIGGAGSRLVGVVFDEITERKRSEANLAFLADVSADLVRLTSIEVIMNKLGAKIGGYFQASRCAFFEFNEALDGAKCEYDWHQAEDSSLIGSYRLSDFYTEEFLQTVRAGHTFVVSDCDTDPRVNAENIAAINVASYIVVPMSINNQLRFTLCVLDSQPRYWNDKEVELMRELTDRIWTRLERARVEEALVIAANQKDEFIAVAAHELKTPVTSVKVYAQVLEQRFRNSGDMASADMIQKITMQVDKLANLISDLLDVTKIESGKLEFKHEHFTINDLVKEIVEEVQRTTGEHKFLLVLKENTSVFADRDRIGQVLINLFSNAIKYSPHTKEIQISSTLEGENIIIGVKDFGSGIAKEQQKKIFERFHRVPGHAKETYPGLGLGLYISSEIIKRHNGRIWVESTENKGSTFYFSLPSAQ